ncbi:MAG TPA: formyltransferase family protein, partial [Candidatus Limnocylindria bacterium]
MGGIGRIAFLGTGSFGVPLLSRVASVADELIVLSQPDRPAGRRLHLRATPVASYAREHGIPVLTPHRLRSGDAADSLRAFAPDGLLLAAYGQLVPQ